MYDEPPPPKLPPNVELTWKDFGIAIDEAVNELVKERPFDGRILLQGISAFTAQIMAVMKDDGILTAFIGEVIGDYLHATNRCSCSKEEKAGEELETEVAEALAESKNAIKN